MKFGLAVTSSLGMEKSFLIHSLSDDMEIFFKDKNYGKDIKAYTIGVYCVDVPVGFEKFSKIPKPKYTKGKKIINPDGIPFTLEDDFECSIKLDFATFKDADEYEARAILAHKILKSLELLEGMKEKIKDFDDKRFKKDIEGYFKEKNIL